MDTSNDPSDSRHGDTVFPVLDDVHSREASKGKRGAAAMVVPVPLATMADDLAPDEIEGFVREGYVAVRGAFSPETAAAARAILWRDLGCDPHDAATWTQPVVRLWDYPQRPFREAANTPALRAALDALVGPGRWQPRESLGTFPIRFPSTVAPGDDGWHVDASFGEDPGDSTSWRVNVESRGRALLMLFLFSDVGDNDAPTRIRVGSHQQVARLLEPAGPAGPGWMELSQHATQAT
ncbi:MAG: hypothetical protein J2P17_32710, partial [Mycobacterium sp.]|nr:hypothetical protein [Mycobacterium sp.]